MKNYLLIYCRERSRLTEKQIATKAGLTLKSYQDLEASQALMTEAASKALGRLFRINSSYLLISSSQLEMLSVAQELVQAQKEMIDILTIGA